MRLDTYIRVLRLTQGAANALNERAQTWPDIGGTYGAVMALSDEQVAENADERGVSRATFRVRDNTLTRSVTIKDRLSVRGEVWQVTGCALSVSTRRGYRDISAVRRSDDNGE